MSRWCGRSPHSFTVVLQWVIFARSLIHLTQAIYGLMEYNAHRTHIAHTHWICWDQETTKYSCTRHFYRIDEIVPHSKIHNNKKMLLLEMSRTRTHYNWATVSAATQRTHRPLRKQRSDSYNRRHLWPLACPLVPFSCTKQHTSLKLTCFMSIHEAIVDRWKSPLSTAHLFR